MLTLGSLRCTHCKWTDAHEVVGRVSKERKSQHRWAKQTADAGTSTMLRMRQCVSDINDLRDGREPATRGDNWHDSVYVDCSARFSELLLVAGNAHAPSPDPERQPEPD